MTSKTMIVSNGVKIINDRVYHSPTYSLPNRFKVAINTSDVNYTDTGLTTLIPISGTETVDDCYSITGWSITGIGNSISGNQVTYKPDTGTGGSLCIVKTGTGTTLWTGYKTESALNGSGKDFLAWVYIKDSSVLSNLNNGTGVNSSISFIYGSDSNNYLRKDVTLGSLTGGWNFISSSITGGFTSISGSPTLSNLVYLKVTANTSGTGSLINYGDVIFDSIRLASSDDYYKAVDSITSDDIEGSTSVISKLTISEANGFLINGHSLFNTDTSEIMYSKAKLQNNSKGITDLFKITTKTKFRNINQ